MSNALSEHLRNPLDHGRLAFHPDCPICHSERLVGALPSSALVSARTRAGLAAAVLAASMGGAPAVAIATPEPDQDYEGQGNEDAPGRGGSADSLDFDPGGSDEAQDNDPEGGGQPDDADQDDVTDTVEAEPEVDTEALEAEQQERLNQGVPPAPQAPDVPATTTPQVPSTPGPPQQQGEPGGPSGAGQVDEAKAGPKEKQKSSPERSARQQGSTAPAPQQPETPPTTETEPAQQQVEQVAPPQGAGGGSTDIADRSRDTHVVKPGETLWSIAAGLIGPDASAAEIAREVDRLWRLNAERIGTGSPDLIMSGQKLIV